MTGLRIVGVQKKDKQPIRIKMLHGRRTPHSHTSRQVRIAQTRKTIQLVNKDLQWRYALILGVTSFILVSAFSLPAWYFVRENYDLFTKIAYESHPGFVTHLEREQAWITGLLILGTIAGSLITVFTTLRITTLLLGPLANMERHMRKLIRGDWSAHDFHVRESDEMREITTTYAYLYRTLRAQAEADVRMLEKIIIDPRQTEASRAWLTLMNLKRKQLGLSEIEISAESAGSPDLRRVS